jgi:hypothetical protein
MLRWRLTRYTAPSPMWRKPGTLTRLVWFPLKAQR